MAGSAEFVVGPTAGAAAARRCRSSGGSPRQSGFDQQIWQFPVVLIPLGTAAIPDSVVLRPVHSVDGMTAQSVTMPAALLDCHQRGTAGARRHLRRVLRPDQQTSGHHRMGVKTCKHDSAKRSGTLVAGCDPPAACLATDTRVTLFTVPGCRPHRQRKFEWTINLRSRCSSISITSKSV